MSAAAEARRLARERAKALIESMTDEEDAALTQAALDDPDAQPVPGTARLVPAEGVRRRPGRPRVPSPKQQITLRIDQDVLERFKATGAGWQGRINEHLKTFDPQAAKTRRLAG